MPTVHAAHGPIEYVVDGPESGRPLVVVVGGSAQLVRFPPALVQGLVDHGFRVIRLDNRDAGKSKHFTEAGAPDIAAVQAALKAGEKPNVAYTMDDMGNDVLAVLDALGVAKADLLGVSMGGFIVQTIAINTPERVRSLILIMTSTGNPALPGTDPELQKALGGMAVAAQKGVEELVKQGVLAFKLIGGTAGGSDPEKMAERLRLEYERGFTTPEGSMRHRAATLTSGDRRPKLAKVKVPTLVVHGDADRVLPLVCGEDVAASIPGATLHVLHGMGHELAPAFIPEILEAIVRLTEHA